MSPHPAGIAKLHQRAKIDCLYPSLEHFADAPRHQQRQCQSGNNYLRDGRRKPLQSASTSNRNCSDQPYRRDERKLHRARLPSMLVIVIVLLLVLDFVCVRRWMLSVGIIQELETI